MQEPVKDHPEMTRSTKSGAILIEPSANTLTASRKARENIEKINRLENDLGGMNEKLAIMDEKLDTIITRLNMLSRKS